MECNLYGNSYAYLNKLKAEHNTEAPTTLSIGDSIKLQVMTMNHVAYTITLQAHKERYRKRQVKFKTRDLTIIMRLP
jgi:predicted nucleic acid-binding protein